MDKVHIVTVTRMVSLRIGRLWVRSPSWFELFLIHSSLEHIVTAQLRRMVSHGPLESMVRTVLTVFRKHLGTYIVYLQ